MNPFQRARDSALALRERLLADRANEAVAASDLLSRVEAELNIGIERVASGASELSSGDACLRRDEQYIYVRKDVSADEHAHLVAHELGHFELDSDQPSVTVASLANIEEITGGPAVVRVEAYGARERQELQANVFAREFLLPRHIARQLFTTGVGPRSIASDLKIPLRIVREQILDAVLLPMAAETPEKTLHPPTEDQSAAAKAAERYANVIAGPGTGKTSTLIHRVKYLIEEKDVDPSHILVLTFTNKAAFELVERLRSAGIKRAADIWAGTFHAFGLEFLRKYHEIFGLPSNVIVADKLSAITMLNRELPNVDLKHYLRIDDPYRWLGRIVESIKRLKEELVEPGLFRERLALLQNQDASLTAERLDLAALYEAHERALRFKGLVDFVDLVALPAIAIQSDRPRFSELADKFQHILIDEYQDVTEAMVRLIRQLAQKAKSLWVVGDVRQAIHHWRGASVKSLLLFEQTFQEQAGHQSGKFGKYALTYNRRSSQEIVDLTTLCGEKHALQKSLPLSRTKSSMGNLNVKPSLLSCASKQDIPDAVALTIERLRGDGFQYSQQAVLCRRTADVELVARDLHGRGIPTLYIGELAQRIEVKRLLCLMQLLAERQPRALVGLAHFGDLPLSMTEINEVISWADESVTWQRGRWIQQTFKDLKPNLGRAKEILAKLLRGHTRYSMPWDLLCDVVLEHRFGIPPLSDHSIDAHVSRIALWQFLNSVLIGDVEGKRPSLSRYLLRQQLRQRIGETYSDRELPSEAAALDAVRVQTVHGSKGLEFASVHLGYVDKDSYGEEKSNWKPDDDITDLVPAPVLGSTTAQFEFEQAIERNNLFYVAVSRAQRSLTLYEDGSWADRNRPLQISGNPTALNHLCVMATSSANVSSRSLPNVAGSTVTLEYSHFETYERCPLQYRYRFELGLGREQEVDVAARASFAIMSGIKSLADGTESNIQNAFESAWFSNRLPTEQDDPSLWRDGIQVFGRGVDWARKSGGTFAQPTTKLGNLSIQLPWMLARSQRQGLAYDLLRFTSNGVTGSVTLLRPMLSGLSMNSIISISSLIGDTTVREVPPSKKVSSTNAMAAAIRFASGDRSAKRGRQCRFCPYLTICPANPS